MLYSGKFRNNSPFSSGERLDFVELQDAKLTKKKKKKKKKNEDFHKRDAAYVIFIFTGRLMR